MRLLRSRLHRTRNWVYNRIRIARDWIHTRRHQQRIEPSSARNSEEVRGDPWLFNTYTYNSTDLPENLGHLALAAWASDIQAESEGLERGLSVVYM